MLNTPFGPKYKSQMAKKHVFRKHVKVSWVYGVNACFFNIAHIHYSYDTLRERKIHKHQ